MPEQSHFAAKLFGYLDRGEKLFLALLIGGILLEYSGMSASGMLIVGAFAGLAAIFFLTAFRPPALAENQGEVKLDFFQLLLSTIVPKVLWISCAVCAFSPMLYHFETGNDGYKQGLRMHFATTILGLLIIGIARLRNRNEWREIAPIFFRAVPLMLAAVHLLGYL